MQLVDTHCHLHDSEFYPETREEAYQQSRQAGVTMLCVGTDARSSREAVEFARMHEGCYAVVGIHPHEASTGDAAAIRTLLKDNHDRIIVGIGEIGLDYYYDHSPRQAQQTLLRAQLELAREYQLPVSFHVRDATSTEENGAVWRDFWPLLDDFSEVKGVLHSFTDTSTNAEEALRRGLFIGINGISTFTKDENQRTMYASIPIGCILLETDAPFLTPAPFRGKMNIPAYVEKVAAHQAELRNVPLEEIARTTTANAEVLFGKLV